MKQKEIAKTFLVEKTCCSLLFIQIYLSVVRVNPFKPEFTIVIFIHYKPRFAGAILEL